jgi:DNA-binding transcriptional LysR family regulator
MLDWDDLRFFLDAVRAGNYTEAAKRLKVNRTTVGRRLAQLEQRVGASLFEQTGTGYRPTARGRIVLEKARAMEQAVDDMIAALQVQASAHSGLIRVASSAEIGLEFMGEFADFPALHPGVRIEFLALPDAFNALVERKADLALCVARTRPRYLAGPWLGQLTQAPYAARALAGVGGPLPWVGWGEDMSDLPGRWIKSNLPVEAPLAAAFNSWSALKQAVQCGIGAAHLWCFAADLRDDLVALGPPDPRWNAELWLLYRADVPPDPRASLLVDFLVPRIKRRLAAPSAVEPVP